MKDGKKENREEYRINDKERKDTEENIEGDMD
jgi:hypothetical protein